MMTRQKVKIMDVCSEIFAGGDAPKNRMSIEKTSEYTIPIYSNGEDKNGLYGYTDVARVNLPSITVSARGTIGYTAIRKEPFVPIVRLIAVTPIPELIDIDYLYYAIKYFNFSGSGTSIPQLTVPMIKQCNFPLPPLDEQRKIAAVLDKVSDLIAKRRQQLDKLDELVKARFVEMFGGKDYPYKELISLIKEGAGLSYGIVQPGDDGTGDMGVLRPVDLTDGTIDTASIKYIDRTIAQGYKKTELNGEELLITVRGTTGITALTDHRFCGMNVTRGIAVIRYDNDKINPVYLNCYLKTDEGQRYIQEHTRGATLQQINLSDLRIQQILVPPMGQQDQFAVFAKQIESTKTTISCSLEKLETLKKALMQKYFGE